MEPLKIAKNVFLPKGLKKGAVGVIFFVRLSVLL
jgi:hypothetical protein